MTDPPYNGDTPPDSFYGAEGRLDVSYQGAGEITNPLPTPPDVAWPGAAPIDSAWPSDATGQGIDFPWPDAMQTTTKIDQGVVEESAYAGPAWVPLIVALAGPLVIGIVSLVWGSTWMRAVAWALVCGLGFGFLLYFTVVDNRRRASNWYIARDDIVSPVRLATVVVTLVLSLWNAWLFADWFARLPMFLGAK